MRFKLGVFFSLAVVALGACGGGGPSGIASPPVPGGGTTLPPGVAPQTIGVALPPGNIGQIMDPVAGLIGGFTQTTFSQRLGFAAGATITIKNVGTTTHTFNVIGTGLPFPATPALTIPSGPTSTTISPNYASGNLAPGASVTLTLTPGTWLIGCAYHYLSNNMRTVLTVPGTPGPQATPVPGTGGGGNPCPGGYC